ncbi:MAG: dihydroneopterin aldolase [Campylobacterota bacterium]|nr:dihydroneopterin aldolase [Campylobacterota bacterium]
MTININNLTFKAIIGLLDFERITEQKVLVDCQIEYEYSSNFINYAVVAELIEAEIKSEKFQLIEEALLHLEKKIHVKFPNISILELKITKPDILNNCTVSVGNKAIFKGS